MMRVGATWYQILLRAKPLILFHTLTSKNSPAFLSFFGSITSETAGSLSGGPSTGLIWPNTNDLTISSVEQVEEWFNSRLFPRDDITPRNLIWLDGGRICLLDWESAGFYPRQLEFASLFYQEYHFGDVLLSAIGFGSERDKEEQQKICQALYNNERYTFRPPDILEGSKASSIFPLPQIPEPQKFSF
ncbi:hypothetical protein EYB25_009543 [Talaromyces marneffei]|nr:hypothetical protein EYB25_009543 [Talaromyces marneffei]